VVKAHESRPVKLEGNSEHPDSNGATDSYAQASLRACIIRSRHALSRITAAPWDRARPWISWIKRPKEMRLPTEATACAS